MIADIAEWSAGERVCTDNMVTMLEVMNQNMAIEGCLHYCLELHFEYRISIIFAWYKFDLNV